MVLIEEKVNFTYTAELPGLGSGSLCWAYETLRFY